jgi:hypothetical protein
MFGLIGKAPVEKEHPTTDRVHAGVTYKWIRANFAKCPIDASDEVIEQYAHTYLWYVILRTLFTDSRGRAFHGCG